jgi:hypothetical protein
VWAHGGECASCELSVNPAVPSSFLQYFIGKGFGESHIALKEN